MTLPVVQFCFAIANGDTDRVRKLLPEISDNGLFQELNSGISPALFCLWASQQSPELISKKLKELYPNESRLYSSNKRSPRNIQDASNVAVPVIKDKLTTLLSAMIVHMAPDLVDDPSKQFTHTACTAALQFIIDDVELTEDKRTLAQTMLNKFSNIRPAFIQMSNARPNVLEELLEEQKNYLPLLKRVPSARELEKRLDHHSKNLLHSHRKKSAPTA